MHMQWIIMWLATNVYILLTIMVLDDNKKTGME